ncbi:MAG: flagellar basal body P-ring formation protein FlgA [Burkholderiaceae bacterium]|nr:flagellar basal body P-ring formation protein FlgA [Burkholderiaceae bacterium]
MSFTCKKKWFAILLLLPMCLSFAQVPQASSAPVAGSVADGVMPHAELVSIARRFLESQLDKTSMQYEISVQGIDSRLKLPVCANPVAYLPTGSKMRGRTNVGIRCASPAWHTLVRTRIQINAEYVVATAPLSQGHVVRAEDISLVKGDMTNMRPGVLQNKEHAIGKSITRAMQAGSPLWPENLRAPLAIQPGQQVQVVGKGDGFSVNARGQAAGSAALGQMAQVRMPNGAIIRGVAREGGIIEVVFR